MTDILADIKEEFQAAKVQLASRVEAENIECKELVTPALPGISTLPMNDEIPELSAEPSKIPVNQNQHESEENPRITEDSQNLATRIPPFLIPLSDCGFENHESPCLLHIPNPTASSSMDHATGVQPHEVLQSNAWSSSRGCSQHWRCRSCYVYEIRRNDGSSAFQWICCCCGEVNSVYSNGCQ
jgi:hypothetical protein